MAAMSAGDREEKTKYYRYGILAPRLAYSKCSLCTTCHGQSNYDYYDTFIYHYNTLAASARPRAESHTGPSWLILHHCTASPPHGHHLPPSFASSIPRLAFRDAGFSGLATV